MTKITVCIDLEEAKYKAYAREAERQGRTVEDLLRRAIRLMFLEQDERLREEEEDHPIQFS